MGTRIAPGLAPARIATPRLLLDALGPAQETEVETLAHANRAALEPWLRVPPPGTIHLPEGSPNWGIRLRDGVLAGVIQLVLACDRVSVGYWLAPAHTRMGYATEAARAVVSAAFARGAELAEIRCAIANTASARVAMRLGFAPVHNDGEIAVWQLARTTTIECVEDD